MTKKKRILKKRSGYSFIHPKTGERVVVPPHKQHYNVKTKKYRNISKQDLWILDENILTQLLGWKENSDSSPTLAQLQQIIEGADPEDVRSRIEALKEMGLIEEKNNKFFITNSGERMIERI